MLDAALAAAVGGVIGGRAAYVAAKWAYYQDPVRRALRPWDGGLSWHEALAGRVETHPGQGVLWALSMELPDLYGIRAPRVAVQLLRAGWSAVTLTTLAFAGRRPRFEGLAFPLWVALYSAGSSRPTLRRRPRSINRRGGPAAAGRAIARP